MGKKQVKQSRFMSINYSRVVCEGCGEESIIEPGTEFHGLNCSCKVKAKKDDKEISTPVQDEKEYTHLVTVIGTFKDGDYEVCANNDLDNTYRVPKETFESEFEVAVPLLDTKVNLCDTCNLEFATCNVKDYVPGDGLGNDNVIECEDHQPIPPVQEEGTITLSIEDIKEINNTVENPVEAIKAAYNMDELRVLAKSVKIRGASNMGEQKLVERLLTKAN